MAKAKKALPSSRSLILTPALIKKHGVTFTNYGDKIILCKKYDDIRWFDGICILSLFQMVFRSKFLPIRRNRNKLKVYRFYFTYLLSVITRTMYNKFFFTYFLKNMRFPETFIQYIDSDCTLSSWLCEPSFEVVREEFLYHSLRIEKAGKVR